MDHGGDENRGDRDRQLILNQVRHRVDTRGVSGKHRDRGTRRVADHEDTADHGGRGDPGNPDPDKQRVDRHREQHRHAGGGRHHEPKEVSKDKDRAHDEVRVPEPLKGFQAHGDELIRCPDLIHIGREAARDENDETGRRRLVAGKRGEEPEEVKTDKAGAVGALRHQIGDAPENRDEVQRDAGEKQKNIHLQLLHDSDASQNHDEKREIRHDVMHDELSPNGFRNGEQCRLRVPCR